MHANLALGLVLAGLALSTGSLARADGLGGCASESNRLMNWSNGCLDTERGLVWGFSPPTRMSQNDANRFCGGMTPIKTPDGSLTAWGLPSIKDVRVLSTVPALQTYMNFAVDQSFWTSDFEAGYGATAIPATGAHAIVDSSELARTVCVARVTGCVEETDRFQSGAGGCVDKSKGVVWGPLQKSGWTHQGAVSFCENSSQFGFSDWKMASESLVKEMIQSRSLTFLYPTVVNSGGIWLGESGLYWTGDYFASDYSGMVGPTFACVRTTK